MGNWAINIEGVGPHHNLLNETDANRMAADFVQRLKDAGHTVRVATFHHGGADYIDSGKNYLETQDEIEAAEKRKRRL